jgi:uncharacterized protein YcaQ
VSDDPASASTLHQGTPSPAPCSGVGSSVEGVFRNALGVLHARVADYDPGWCDLLYKRRKIFEAYNKGLSLVPVSEFAWFRATLSRNAPQTLVETDKRLFLTRP